MKKTRKLEKKKEFRKEDFKKAFIDIINIIKNNYKRFIPWALATLVLTLLSLVQTELGQGPYMLSFPKILLLVFPRLLVAFTFTCSSLFFNKKACIYSLLSSLFFIYIGIIGRSPLYLTLILAGLSLSFALFFSFYEKKKSIIEINTKKYKKILSWFMVFFTLTIVIETVHLFSIFKAFAKIVEFPDMFMINVLIVILLGLFIFICRKRGFALTLYCAFWVILSFISYLKYINVNEPVLFLDIFQIHEAISAALKLFGWFELTFILMVIAAIILAMVFVGKKTKKLAFSMKNLIIVLFLYLILPFPIIGAGKVGSTQTHDRFLRDIFFQDGFVYSFINYSLKSTISEPKGYNQEQIDELIDYIIRNDKIPEAITDVKNIIVIQMESFADPYLFPDAKFERDPIPFMHSLEENFTTGKIDVPIFGGQTVKSEFEFITGLNMDLLPYGYTPYTQHLHKNSIDNFARALNNSSFTTTCIHNFQGEFFNRHKVYQNLGFKRFLPFEVMPNIEKREGFIGAKDSIFTDLISNILDKDEGKHFIYGITVQLHSKYTPLDEDKYSMDFSMDMSQEEIGPIAYYIQQLEDFDLAMKELIEYLEQRDEPTFVLFYADHLPSLFYNAKDITQDEMFTVQFFTWDNLGLEKRENTYMELYQLSTFMCDIVGLEGNIMNKFHRTFYGQEDYLEKLSYLQYYLLEVDKNNPLYENEDYEIGGLIPFSLDEIEYSEFLHTIRVYGHGFTDNTYLSVNNKLYETFFINENEIIVKSFNYKLKADDNISVKIVGEKYGDIFKESNILVYE